MTQDESVTPVACSLCHTFPDHIGFTIYSNCPKTCPMEAIISIDDIESWNTLQETLNERRRDDFSVGMRCALGMSMDGKTREPSRGEGSWDFGDYLKHEQGKPK